MTIAEGSSKQIEGEECDDDVEVRWVGECMARFCLFFTASEDPQSKEMMMMLE